MAQEDAHLCGAGLALGLAIGGAAQQRPRRRREAPPPCALEPALTLSLPDEAGQHGGPSPPQSASSFSVPAAAAAVVKRERAEEAEAEAERTVTSTARASEEEDDGGARKKLRLTKEQSALLEDRFKEHSTLNPKQKVALAKQLNLRPRQVEVWFQNRRARTKLKQTEVDCELLKRCCETLTEENRRLQRELQELRALKLAPPPPPPAASPPPFYVQLPAATLTICPSCERLAAAHSSSSAAGGNDRPKAPPPAAHFFSPFTHSATC